MFQIPVPFPRRLWQGIVNAGAVSAAQKARIPTDNRKAQLADIDALAARLTQTQPPKGTRAG